MSTLAFTLPPALPSLRPVRHTRRPPTTCSARRPPPTSLPDALSLAKPALKQLLSLPAPRVKLRLLIPGLNTLLEDTFPYSDATLNTAAALAALAALDALPAAPCALLFKSAGTAAAARAFYASSPANVPEPFASLVGTRVSLASFAGRDASAAPPYPPGAIVILVNPATARGDPVVRDIDALLAAGAASPTPPAAWVLLNPDFDAGVSALGMAERGARTALLDSFEEVLYLRTLAEIRRPTLVAREVGALVRVWPGQYQLWRGDGRGYEFVNEFETVPGRGSITEAMEMPGVVREGGEGRQFGDEDRAYLGTLLALAVVASAMLYALKMAGKS